jgi:hypothetical protein
MENRYTAAEWAAMEGGQEVAAPATSIKLPFLQELVEARMYRNASTLSGKTAKELARVAYLMFMMLEILRHEDKQFAKRYSVETMWYDNFASMKSTASDLHNVLAVLSNQDKYAGKIKTDATIAVPILQIRKYLRDIENDRKEKGVDRALFKTLSEFLKVSDSDLRELRMYVADWDQTSITEKRKLRLQIKNLLQATNHQNDLLIQFRTKL